MTSTAFFLGTILACGGGVEIDLEAPARDTGIRDDFVGGTGEAGIGNREELDATGGVTLIRGDSSRRSS